MTMAPPAAPAAPASTTGPRTGPARRRPGEFGTGRKFTPRRKVCQFCVDKIKEVDYKDLIRLRRFLSERGKIEPRRKTGTCATHQRSLNIALKRARQLALLPFTAEHIRVTGVLVREPGAPPFRGARPRPQELDGTPADGTPPDGATAVAAETPPDGQAAAADATAEPATPAAVAEATPASPADVAETAAAESAGEATLPVTQGQQA
jgi:small subunit ribosomal protein S18